MQRRLLSRFPAMQWCTFTRNGVSHFVSGKSSFLLVSRRVAAKCGLSICARLTRPFRGQRRPVSTTDIGARTHSTSSALAKGRLWPTRAQSGQAVFHQFFSIPTDIMRSVVKLPYRTMCRSFLITGMDRSNPAPCDICQDGVSERDQPVLQFYRQVIRVPAKDRRLTALPAFNPR